MNLNQGLTSENFLKVVDASFFHESQNVRRTNETILTQFMTSHPNSFVEVCTKIFSDERANLQHRKTIGMVLRLAVKPLRANFEMSIWNKISSQHKDSVKMVGLKCLIDPQDLVRKTAADLVADVFCLDCLTDKSWTGLLPTLTSNLNNEDRIIQNSAIMTLGYICERLHTEGINRLSAQEIDAMVSGICQKLDSYDENTLTALKSLEYSLNFISESLKNEKMASFIMNLVVGVLVQANTHRNVDLVLQSVICLNELHVILGASFAPFLPVVVEKLFDSYAIKDKKLTIAVNDFFQSVLSPEQDHGLANLLANHANGLVEKILESMLFLLQEELNQLESDEKSPLIESCVLVMSSVNSAFLVDTYDNLMKFVTHFIDKQDSVSRIAALSVIESMICVAGNQSISEMVLNMFNGLNAFVSTQDIHLQIAAINVLRKVASFYPREFMHRDNFLPTIRLINQYLLSSANNERLCGHLTLIIENLAERVDMLQIDQFRLLSESLDMLLKNLFVAAESSQTLHVIDRYFSTTMIIFNKILPKEQYGMWFDSLWKQFLSLKNFNMSDRLVFYVEALFINLNVITQKMILTQTDLSFSGLLENFIQGIFEEVYSLFNKCREILVEPLLFLCSIIEKETQACQFQVNTFLNSYVTMAISKRDQSDLFKAGVSCLGELVKIFGNNLRLYIDQNIDFLLLGLDDASSQQETKIRLFFTLSDIAAHCPMAILKKFNEMLNIINNAFAAVIILQEDPNKENQEFCDALKETLVELLLCIVHGVHYNENELPCQELLRGYFPRIIEFGEKTTKEQYNPTVEYLRDYMMLVTDFYMKEEMRNLSELRLTNYLFDKLSKFRSNPEIKEVLDNYEKTLDHENKYLNKRFV